MKTHGAASKGVPFPQRIEDIDQPPIGRHIIEDIKSMAQESSDSDDALGMSPRMASSPLNMLAANRSNNSDSGHESTSHNNSPEHSMNVNQQGVPAGFMDPAQYPSQPIYYPSPWEHMSAQFYDPNYSGQNASTYWPIDFNNQYCQPMHHPQGQTDPNMPYSVPY